MPVRVWLMLLILAGFTHPWLPDSRWLLVHLFTLGAVTNSILVWSQTLAERFLGYHLPETARRPQLARIYTLNAGIVLTIVGMLGSVWPVTLAGAVVVGAMVAWHAIGLLMLIRRAQLHRAAQGEGRAEHAQSVWFFVASAALLPVGAGFGAALAYGFADPAQAGFLFTHQAMNILGFLGLAAAGVLTVLFPRLLGETDPSARRRPIALAVLLSGIGVLTGGALSDLPDLAAAGVLIYLTGWLVVALPLLKVAVRRPPTGYAAASITAALLWLIGSLIALAVVLIDGPMEADRATLMTVPFLAGFAAQLLFGVMSHLLPTMMSDNPAVRAAGVNRMNRWWLWRVLVINVGLVIWLFPLASWIKVGVSALVMLAFILFLPIMISSAKAAMGVRRAMREGSGQAAPEGAAPVEPAPPAPQNRGQQVIAAMASLALVIAVGSALGGGAGGPVEDAAAGVAPTGQTTTVQVDAANMRFTPDSVTVPVGNRLVINVTNKDTMVHDMVLASGQSTGRLGPDQRATLEVAVVGKSIEGWCSIIGHRQQGMVFHVRTTGGGADANSPGQMAMGPGMAGMSGAATGPAPDVDLMRKPPASFEARDPRLAPAPTGTVHKYTFDITEVPGDFAPGVQQIMWTYNGRPMGPTLRGKLGDTFEVTLVNHGTMGHSIDFHAGMVSPDEPMRTINPGESLVYTFTANHTGVWLYHCATAPMAVHIAAGMFGAVIIDPPDLAPVSAEYVMIQSEAYLGPQGGQPDADKVIADKPDLVMFNGYANQYVYRPLHAKVGDRIRIWVVDAGPNESLAFHVVGSQFDTVYKEGAYLLRPDNPLHGGSQVLDLGVAQGGFVEMQFTAPGTYTFLDHRMVAGDRGAMGKIVVS
ncbi:multicopper oxidase domain-containing protein [Rhodococcus sp. D2-41]|uniref:multicopper oxidase domain-containing protein n=1 Tax=Speluncibacter jeojiensis TaxID=2710754 RepID=UPI00240F5F38|nr:multicopper oxidase domain-containing protein [Rhodococcus sp. D2-41]MDG3012651.1 multicopper oxidase domain-containing protein [Rhodococcus sp. D2-41]